MNVAIIILNWNSANDTTKCIDSLISHHPALQIVVVDNGSSDDSVNKLLNYKKKIVLLKNEHNLGFAGGVNVGIKWCTENGFDFIALLNNDATVERKWIDNLISCMKDKKIGIVTGLLLDEYGENIDSTGEFFSKWGLAFPRNRNDDKNKAPSGGYVFGATGGASLYRVSMLNEIGLFDEDFFAYYEDVDISFRAQLAGWKVYFNPKAIAYHKRGATSKKIPGFTVYQTFKNLPLLFIKNVPVGLWLKVLPRFKLAYALIFFNAVRNGDGKYALKGVLAGLVLVFKNLPKRYQIQKSRKVSIKYIESILWDDLPPEQTGLRKFRRIFTGIK